jgi:hypothetical protein
MKDFSSFMDQQFSGHFGPFGGGGIAGSRSAGSPSNRREDDYDMADERMDQHPMESNAELDDSSSRRRPPLLSAQSKTNYDYHPIIDFFHDKP